MSASFACVKDRHSTTTMDIASTVGGSPPDQQDTVVLSMLSWSCDAADVDDGEVVGAQMKRYGYWNGCGR